MLQQVRIAPEDDTVIAMPTPQVLLLLPSLLAGVAHAQSMVFVENATDHELKVADVRVSGDPLSAKAWQQTADTIAPGERVGVLSINRSGKVNWMDPTPRFVEPGKTVVFTTVLESTGDAAIAPVTLLQKLEGTGSGSRMWYSIGSSAEGYRPEADTRSREGVLGSDEEASVEYRYRAVVDGKRVHVEYLFGVPD